MNKKIKVKNIIFDLSEVLFTGIKDTGIMLAEKHNLDTTGGHRVAWSHIKTPLLTPLVEELFRGNITEDDYIKDVLLQYPQLGREEELKELIRKNFQEVEGTRGIIIELKNKGYKLALLSIHSKEWIEYCEQKFDFQKLFDTHSYSYDEKVLKPDPDAFHNVLKKLNATPEECIFIDDAENNIAAAETIGIKSILFTNAKSLSNSLKEVLPDFNF